MKVAFLYSGANQFNSLLLRELKQTLRAHEVLSWIAGEEAPSRDLDVLITNSSVGREQIASQSKLALIQTASTGYETVDIDAATEMGVWVSYAPSNSTGNATSVAEFAILLLLGASRHLGQVIESVHGGPTYPPQIHPALNGKTVCIVGLGSIGRQIVDRLRPFGVLMVATDEHPENSPVDVTAIPADKLELAVAVADYVVRGGLTIPIRLTCDDLRLITFRSDRKAPLRVNPGIRRYPSRSSGFFLCSTPSRSWCF